jgi:hypothetical protein
MIKTPPIVGVPAFLRWVCGPSSLIVCPNCLFLIKKMNFFPIKSPRKRAIKKPANERTVIYRKR